MTKTKKRRIRLPNKVQNKYDFDYLKDLNQDDLDWMMNFIDGTYNNNHRKYDIFTEHPDYERIKKEIYSETNALNRCQYSDSQVRNQLLSLEGAANRPVGSKNVTEELLDGQKIKDDDPDSLLVSMGIKTHEDILTEILEDTIKDIDNKYVENRPVLLRFYSRFKKQMLRYKKQLSNDRLIERKKNKGK